MIECTYRKTAEATYLIFGRHANGITKSIGTSHTRSNAELICDALNRCDKLDKIEWVKK